MKNMAIWLVGLFVILFVAGKTPKSEHSWLICEFGILLWWTFYGGMMLIRFMYRFVVK